MRTETTHRNTRRTTLKLVALVAAIATAVAATLLSLSSPAQAQAAGIAPTYGWPIKPFGTQHPIRGAFGDPRISGKSHSFHFGVDVACPNGTPVYATVSGRAYIHPNHSETVSVIAADGVRIFGYWHVRPTIRSGQSVTAYQTVIGTVLAPWEHVHFVERRNGVYVNPLRPGAMGPYKDTTVPTIRSFAVEAQGKVRQARIAYGQVDLVVESYEQTPISIAGPWHNKPLTPALLQWRLVDGTRTLVDWRTAVDFRLTYPSNATWNRTYAELTRQNKKIWTARYRFFLTHSLDTQRLQDGSYRVDVRATDIRGNTGTASFTITVANDA